MLTMVHYSTFSWNKTNVKVGLYKAYWKEKKCYGDDLTALCVILGIRIEAT